MRGALRRSEPYLCMKSDDGVAANANRTRRKQDRIDGYLDLDETRPPHGFTLPHPAGQSGSERRWRHQTVLHDVGAKRAISVSRHGVFGNADRRDRPA